jgi:hypothetical protein
VIEQPPFKLTTAQDRAMDVLVSDAMHSALGGGSRSGKTFLLVRAILMRAIKSPGSRHAIFRFRFNSIKASIIYDTLPKVLDLCFPDLPPLNSMLNKTDWFMSLPNGSEIWFGGLDDKERTEKVLGQEYVTIYFNEASQIPYSSMLLALTRLAQRCVYTDPRTGEARIMRLKSYTDFNPPSKRHWTYQRFISKVDPFSKAPTTQPANYGFFLINPGDNTDNLPAEYLELLNSMPTKERNRFLLGQFADDADGALWTDELLHQQRVLGQEGTLPDFIRIIVAIDPSGCSGPEDTRSDEIGIVVVALGTDRKGYLLEDLSGRYGPEEWGQIAADAYERHNADKIVGEQNFGGDMVRAVVHAVNPDLPFGLVHASRGKVVRAEPIATLYEMGKIHHVGYFKEIEDQMCAMNQGGYIGETSPDRLDATVWGFTELFPKMTKKRSDEYDRQPRVVPASRSASRFDRTRQRR